MLGPLHALLLNMEKMENLITKHVNINRYRAPEVLLHASNYNSPIDMWALGCIVAEVYTFRPLFPGASEVDEIFKICSILGTPSQVIHYLRACLRVFNMSKCMYPCTILTAKKWITKIFKCVIGIIEPALLSKACCMYMYVSIQNTWNEGLKLAGLMKFKFPTMVSTNLGSLIPNASSEGIKLINQMLLWDPQQRIGATQVIHS